MRQSVLMGTQVLLMQAAFTNPSFSLTKIVTPYASAIFDKKTIKRIETKMEQLKSQMDPSVLKEASEQASALNESVKSFKEHNKRGRPSKPRKRGRPVDTGKEE